MSILYSIYVLINFTFKVFRFKNNILLNAEGKPQYKIIYPLFIS